MLKPLVLPAHNCAYLMHQKFSRNVKNGTGQVITNSVPGKQNPHTIYHTTSFLIMKDVFHHIFMHVA